MSGCFVCIDIFVPCAHACMVLMEASNVVKCPRTAVTDDDEPNCE